MIRPDSTPTADAALIQKSLLALRDQRRRVAELEARAHAPIAVLGIGCRLPGAGDVDAFWQLLTDGRDAISEVPPERWQLCGDDDRGDLQDGAGYAGLLDDLAGFDPEFFGITPREALSLDPQQRWVLECGWRALEDAGIAADGLRDSATGVFIGATARDYAARLQECQQETPIDSYYVSGNSLNFIAGRLAYTLGLRGPAFGVDTACSSALTAIHLAINALRRGECRLALAGGVNLVLAPEVSEASVRSHLLAADGRCKTFDAAADGIVRGEGCGMLVLMRLDEALRSGHPVLAVLRGSAINQDGASSGLMTPNPDAQAAVVRAALADAGLAADDIDYIEAHGTGTALGDPIELRALSAVFRSESREQALLVGSVKTNIGHLESASGVAGLIKAILALRHEWIPAHLHLRAPTPHFDWSQAPLQVPVEAQAWPRGERPRRAGVSAFGGSGSNAHLVVEEAPASKATVVQTDRPHLLMLSARSEPALLELRAQWRQRLASVADADELAALCARAANGRALFQQRFAAVGDDPGSLSAALAGEGGWSLQAQASAREPEVAFLFTGQGAQYLGMGRGLYSHDPAFRAALDALAEPYRAQVGEPLDQVLWQHDGELLGQARCLQPAIFSLQMALTEAWRARGITPAVVLGHSIGEIAAACVAGVFDVEQGLALAARRGALMQDLCEAGAMAAIAAPAEQVAGWLDEGVEIAARNAARQTVVAGTPASVQAVCARASAAGCRALSLPVSHAFHSAAMSPMLDAFAAHCRTLVPARPKLTLLSSLTGGPIGDGLGDPLHWVRHVREPVAFVDALASLQREQPGALLEIGPGQTLIGLARQAGFGQPAVPSMPREDEASGWQRAAGALFCAGLRLHTPQAAAQRHVAAPGHPFLRRPLLVERRTADRSMSIRPLLPQAWLEWHWLASAPPPTSARPLSLPLPPVDADGGPDAEHGMANMMSASIANSGDAGCLVDLQALSAEAAAPDASPSRLIAAALQRFHRAYAQWSAACPDRPYWLCVDAGTDRDAPTALVTEALQAVALSLVWERRGAPLAVLRCHQWPSTELLAGLPNARVASDPLWRADGDTIACGRLRQCADPLPPTPVTGGDDQVIWITGGLGDFGLALAERLAMRPHRCIVLIGRRTETELDEAVRQRIDALRAAGATLHARACDVSDRSALTALWHEFDATPVTTIHHAAGQLEGNEAVLLDDVMAGAARLAAKVDAAWTLHRLSAQRPVAQFVLYSSASAAWGGPGHSLYAAANAALGALASVRHAGGLPALSIALGPLAGTRMAAGSSGAQTAAAGLRAMPLPAVLDAIEQLQATASPTAILADADWRRFTDVLATRHPMRCFEGLCPADAPATEAINDPLAGWRELADEPRRRELLGAVIEDIGAVLRLDAALDPAQPLHAFGVDSVLALEIRDRLCRRFGLDLPATLVFERPTAAAIVELLDTRLFGTTVTAPVVERLIRAEQQDAVAIIGMSARFPGGADDLGSYWRVLLDGVDGVVQRPDARFDVSAWVDGDAADRPYTMALGALGDIEQFDAALFGIAPREAALMDPQQRLVLQGAWHAFEHAGMDPMALHGQRAGVFLGVADNEYLPLLREHVDLTPDLAYLGTGSKLNVIAGRVSYVFGLEGPSLAVDTACSSSAVAVHLACRSLLGGETELALAGGVNLVLDPQGFAPPCRARMLAPDGRCKTFDASADGYVRAEGCGLLVLKRLSDAQRDGDRIVAVIRGSAVNQDGRSSSLTAPSGDAQQAVIAEALSVAGLRPEQIDYVEAHGTGTGLGDPIELRALQSVFGPGRIGHRPLAMGSVKSQIGHAEAAAGAAGLIKVALALQHRRLPGSLHHRQINPAAGELPALDVVTAARDWPGGDSAHAALSAFGFSGTNAHLVLSAAPECRAADGQALPLLCIGAADGERLTQLAGRWRKHLRDTAAAAYPALCAGSRHRRWAGVQRLAIVAGSAEAALAKLQALADGDPVQAGVFRAAADAECRIMLDRVGPMPVALDGELAALQAECSERQRQAIEPGLWPTLTLAARLSRLAVAPACWQAGSAPLPVLGWLAGVFEVDVALALLAGEPLPEQPLQPAARRCLGCDGRDLTAALATAAFWAPGMIADQTATEGDGLSLSMFAAALGATDDDSTVDASLLGLAHVHGCTLRWPDAAPAVVNAPLYPFAPVRHWPHAGVPLVPRRPAGSAGDGHYLLGRRRRLPRSNEQRFQRRFTATSPAYVDHHRLLGTVVVPAASHLSMVLSAWRRIGGGWPCVIEDITLLTPLVIHDDGARDVELILSREADDRYTVELLSCDVATVDDDAWVTHVRCRLHGEVVAQPAPVTVTAVRDGWQPTVDPQTFYERFWEHGYTLGSSFRWLDAGWIDGDATVRRLQVPELPDALDPFELYPGLIDTCFSVLSSGRLDWSANQDHRRIFIPVAIERLEFFGWHAPHGECWAHAVARQQQVAEHARAREDICLFEPDGHVVARIVGFETRHAQRDALRLGYHESARNLLYRLAWQPAELAAEASSSAPVRLLDSGSPVGDALLADWTRATRSVHRSALLPDASDDLDAHFAAVFDGALSDASGALDVVVLLPAGAQAGAAARRPLHALLAAWRALAARIRDHDLRLVVVTSAACRVLPDDLPQPVAAAAWGLVRGLAAEHADRRIALVDLDPADTPVRQAATVQRALGQDCAGQSAWRDGQRFVPLLERHRPGRAWPELALRSDARYVVSGAFGGIGTEVVRWLLECGANTVQLLVRTQQDAVWQALQRHADARGARLELHLIDADAGVPALVEQHALPLAGILHLAGATDDVLAVQSTAERVERVLAGKWDLGVALAELAERARPDFVLMFGSLAATVPAPGQSAYAAANAALEAIAWRLRRSGIAAACVGFGPWAEAGMSARLGDGYQRRLADMGFTPFSNERGLHLLGQLAQDELAAPLCMAVQWPKFLAARPDLAGTPLLQAFVEAAPAAASMAAAGTWRGVLDAAVPGQRDGLLVERLRRATASVLGIADPQQIGRGHRLFDLGLDSMAAMDLREILQRELGIKLRATVLFDYPSIDALGRFLLDTVYPQATAAAATIPRSALDIDALSDEEAEAMLLAELADGDGR